MNCPNCGASNEENARFCIQCGATITPTSVTGPTRRFDEPAPPVVAPAGPTFYPPTRWWQDGRLAQMTGGVWLIGLGILFLTGWFWPGILVLIGLTSFMQLAARGKQQEALSSATLFIGLSILFTVGFWPGILIVLGISALISQWSRFQR